MKSKLFPFVLLLILSNNIYSQKDTLFAKAKIVFPEPYHRNVIKFNPTPMLLLSDVRNITIDYERLIKKNQSLSFQAGYLLFPRLADDTVANLILLTGRSKNGLNLSLDYRYYPGSRNRRPAPDGLYLGSYLSYYGFGFKNTFKILQSNLDENGSLEGKLSVINLGIMMGYQFVFWKRFTLDLLLFGPSLSHYSGKLEFKGQLDPDQINDIDQELVDKVSNRFPLLREAFSRDGLVFTGNKTTLGIGFRYSIQLGFHF